MILYGYGKMIYHHHYFKLFRFSFYVFDSDRSFSKWRAFGSYFFGFCIDHYALFFFLTDLFSFYQTTLKKAEESYNLFSSLPSICLQ